MAYEQVLGNRVTVELCGLASQIMLAASLSRDLRFLVAIMANPNTYAKSWHMWTLSCSAPCSDTERKSKSEEHYAHSNSTQTDTHTHTHTHPRTHTHTRAHTDLLLQLTCAPSFSYLQTREHASTYILCPPLSSTLSCNDDRSWCFTPTVLPLHNLKPFGQHDVQLSEPRYICHMRTRYSPNKTPLV